MSASMVHPLHVNALLYAGLALCQPGERLRWLARRLTVEEQVTAFRRGAWIGPGGGDVYRQLARELTRQTAGRVGAMLLAENARSVNHRYDFDDWERVFEYVPLKGAPSPMAVLGAIAYYEVPVVRAPRLGGVRGPGVLRGAAPKGDQMPSRLRMGLRRVGGGSGTAGTVLVISVQRDGQDVAQIVPSAERQIPNAEQSVAAALLEAWNGTDTAQDIGGWLTCHEAEALARVYAAFGLHSCADAVRVGHMIADDEHSLDHNTGEQIDVG